jgi:two-component system response regulator HydG
MKGRILIVDDEQSMCDMVHADMTRRGLESRCCTSAEEALAVVSDEPFDVVLTDLNMPGISGIDLCTRLATNRPDVPVVVMTAFGSLETAVAAIRAGAYDFLTKPFEMEHLALTVERALQHRELTEKVRVLGEEVERSHRFEELLGESPVMTEMFDQLARIADSETSVLVIGESGSGKELIARALHHRSRRRDRPFVAINCAAIPENLLESALFGHVKGAFTDARQDQAGIFEQADRGTLLLDEIGDLPLTLQPKLLRALEERVVRPVGSAKDLPFDVRLVASTHRDLETAVQEQQFREDLFYRVNVIQIDVPPLRARGTDVLLLAQRFLEKYARRADRTITGLSPAAAERLMAYSWPGNVRELRNAIERAVALTKFDQIAVDDLPERMRDYRSTDVVLAGDDPTELMPLVDVEQRYILHVMDALGGNRTLAARTLGIDRKTLYRKLKSYGYEGGNNEA